MRTCSNCYDSPKKCKVSTNLTRCVECVRKGAANCNLSPFNPLKQARIQRQRNKKATEAREALAKLNQLQREVNALKKKALAIVKGEVAYIEELEILKNSFGGPRPNDFLFNVSSEKLVLEDNFNQLFVNFNPSIVVPNFKGITTGSFGSSQK